MTETVEDVLAAADRRGDLMRGELMSERLKDELAKAWPNTDEQCTCGHAADQHSLEAICNVEDCPCTGYESWITPEMELAHVRRISGDNAALFAIAGTAVEEVRALVAEWRTEANSIEEISGMSRGAVNYADTLRMKANDLEAIVERYDAAIKEQIK